MGDVWLSHALCRVGFNMPSGVRFNTHCRKRIARVIYHTIRLKRHGGFSATSFAGPYKVADLVHVVTRDVTTPYEMTLAIKQHLLSNYAYSLDVGSILSASPLEDFLFTLKTGYCEHYATAMVIMLRTIGIPAQLGNRLPSR